MSTFSMKFYYYGCIIVYACCEQLEGSLTVYYERDGAARVFKSLKYGCLRASFAEIRSLGSS
jgi:hypothetical protein